MNPILAVFINPALFAWGAAAASVPIIIHLLNRRRFKTVDWAAMRFILESIRKNRRRIRIEEMILLALRCLAVFLLALAVGRYMMSSTAGAANLGSQAQTIHYFILDDSVSMGQQVGNTTSFAKAASDLADAVGNVPTTDKVEVLLTSKPFEDGAVFKIATPTDKLALANKIKGLRPSDTGNQLHLALKRANQVLADDPMPKRLSIYGDFRKIDLDGAEMEEARAELKKLSAKGQGQYAGGGVPITLYAYGLPSGVNLTIQEVKLVGRRSGGGEVGAMAVAGQDLRIQAKVANTGSSRVERTNLSFTARCADGSEASPPVVEVPDRRSGRSGLEPGEVETVTFSYCFPMAGASSLQLRLPSDGLEGDNAAYLALDVRQARRVLLVDGAPDINDPFASESIFAAWVLDPTGDGKWRNQVDVISLDRLGDMSFGDYDAVGLLNVGDLSAQQLESLTRYIENGGGLTIFTGNRTNPAFYNGAFYAGGAGLCPARIGAPVLDAERRKFYTIRADSIADDPVMEVFRGNEGKGMIFLRSMHFYGYTPVAELAPEGASPKYGPVRVLARFDAPGPDAGYCPAVLSRNVGLGRVVMVCTAADTEWSDWPGVPSYLGFMNDLVDSISRLEGHEYTDLVGRKISYPLGPELASAQVTLQTPAYPAQDIVNLSNVAGLASYESPRQAGIYAMKFTLPSGQQQAMFARNVDPREGKLETATEAELKSALGVEFAYVNRMGPTGSVSADVSGREFWKAALAAMLVVLAAEVFLGQRFGHYQQY